MAAAAAAEKKKKKTNDEDFEKKTQPPPFLSSHEITKNQPTNPHNKQLRPGDRYEGELHLGFASGLGMLTRQDGKVYRGEFLLGRRHGCGAQVDLSAFYEEVARGTGAEEAWERTKEAVAATAQRGTFRGDEFDSGPVEDDDDSSSSKRKKNRGSDSDDDDAGDGILPSDREHRFCTLAEVEGTVEEVEHLVARARMFEHKPDGAVSTSLTHDDSGAPAPLMQDPLHYPFGTKWMAPGPLGQCFRLPDDERTLEAMDAAAHNHELVWREFNLPRVIEPGTDMAAAVRHSQRVAQVRLRDAEPREIVADPVGHRDVGLVAGGIETDEFAEDRLCRHLLALSFGGHEWPFSLELFASAPNVHEFSGGVNRATARGCLYGTHARWRASTSPRNASAALRAERRYPVAAAAHPCHIAIVPRGASAVDAAWS